MAAQKLTQAAKASEPAMKRTRPRMRRSDAVSEVAEAAGLLLGHGHGHRMLAEVSHCVAEISEKQRGHVPAHPQTDQNALHRDIGCAPGKSVGGYLPAAGAQPVGEVEQGVPRILALCDAPGDRRYPGGWVAVAEQLERAQLDDLGGEVLADVIGRLVNAPVALEAKAQEVVVTGDDLPGRPGEVDLEHRHVAAQIVDVEDEVIGELAGVPPDDPADTQRSQPELVPRGADRL